MSRYVLDTSAYSQFKRGDPKAVELIDSADWLGMTSIVLGELEIGFLLGDLKRLEHNRQQLSEFLDNSVVELLVPDSSVSRIYAEIVVDLRKEGTPLPSNDVWIAAMAVRTGATVLTYDDHFRAIRRVASIVLPVSPAPGRRTRG